MRVDQSEVVTFGEIGHPVGKREKGKCGSLPTRGLRTHQFIKPVVFASHMITELGGGTREEVKGWGGGEQSGRSDISLARQIGW